jgi:hypothetical protein
MSTTPEQRQIIDALVIKERFPDLERVDAQDIYWRAFGILDREEPMRRQGINWSSDDDPIHTVKQLVVPYESDRGKCNLVLTNFFQWPKPFWGTVEKGIRLEIYPSEGVGVTETERDSEREIWFHGIGEETLFAVDKDGNLDSPLGLVDSAIANSLLEVCAEDQKRQHTEKAEAERPLPVA